MFDATKCSDPSSGKSKREHRTDHQNNEGDGGGGGGRGGGFKFRIVLDKHAVYINQHMPLLIVGVLGKS